MNTTHGGDWAAFQAEYGAAPLDFSANVSPLGVPEGVAEAFREAAREIDRYPDPRCTALCAAIAEKEQVPPDFVLCGNGAADLIWRAVFAAKPRRALVTAPCFGEYEAALEASGCETLRLPLREPFMVTGEIADLIYHNLDLIILCNPNNPTGRTIAPALLQQIVRRCGETGTRLLLDECFLDFLIDPSAHTLKPCLEDFPWLVILRAFTKLYGMAGARLGYVLGSDRAFLEAMRRAGPPWGVSALAQAAGLAALEDDDYVNCLRALIAAERPRLFAALRDLGLRVIPGEANFLLFQSAVPLDAALRKRGILIRNCGSFTGLDESWYRTAVRTPEDNDRLLEALREILP